MALALEVEFLAGVCFAAIGPDAAEPDWPPQPDRVFSALVATWGTHYEPRDEFEASEYEQERKALQWLEGLSVPWIYASEMDPRTAPAVFVPPNDYEIPRGDLAGIKWYRDYLARGVVPPEKGGYKKAWLKTLNVMPDQRKRFGLKERCFPAARPVEPLLRFLWSDADPDQATFNALDRLARDTAYVGHSTSLTRCRFLRDTDARLEEAQPPKRRVYAGRLDELCSAYARFKKSGDKKDRPNPGVRVAPMGREDLSRRNVFGDRWLIFEHVDGVMPDARAAAIVAKTLREALMSGYRQIGHGDAIPPVLSGHEVDGSPAMAPHLAIVPLAFAGFPHADGHVMGFAVVPPSGNDILDNEVFRKVLRQLAPLDEQYGRRVLDLRSREGEQSDRAFSIKLSPTFEPPAGRQSLDPTLYTRRMQSFASVTPIVLDRYLKRDGEAREEEAAAQIRVACERIGLPAPQIIVVHKHSTFEGMPSAYPSGGSPVWMRWRLPQALTGRQLVHAVIRFAEPVDGPVILGAGRFVGMGLCRPLGEGNG